MVVDLNSFHLESASSRKKKITFANPMFNFRELSRSMILHIQKKFGYMGIVELGNRRDLEQLFTPWHTKGRKKHASNHGP